MIRTGKNTALICTSAQAALKIKPKLTSISFTSALPVGDSKKTPVLRIANDDGSITSASGSAGAGLTFVTPGAMNGNLMFPAVPDVLLGSTYVALIGTVRLYVALLAEDGNFEGIGSTVSLLLVSVNLSLEVSYSGNIICKLVERKSKPLELTLHDQNKALIRIVQHEEETLTIKGADGSVLHFLKYDEN